MSSLHRGDDDLHYSDNSHRWIAPSDVEQQLWEAELQAHLEQHRSSMGAPRRSDRPGKCRLPRVAPVPAPATRPTPIRRVRPGVVRRPAA